MDLEYVSTALEGESPLAYESWQVPPTPFLVMTDVQGRNAWEEILSGVEVPILNPSGTWGLMTPSMPADQRGETFLPTEVSLLPPGKAAIHSSGVSGGGSVRPTSGLIYPRKV